jgi:UDP-4-amino-4,6-dideoxy-N-acetyl-beta-L-altrosamine N-acetyltransferase
MDLNLTVNKVHGNSTKTKFRKIVRTDLRILRDWRNSTGIMEYNSQFTLLNMVDQERWFKQIREKNSDRIMFMVMKEKKPIGVCGLIHVNKKDRNADVAIIMGDRKLHGKGYGSEILQRLIEYGFTKLKLHRIGAEIFMYNKSSIRLFQKLNFTYETTLRDSLWRFGRWWDIYLYSILESDYNK